MIRAGPVSGTPLFAFHKPRDFFRLARFDLRTPAEFLEQWVRILFDCIGNELAQDRRKLEAVPAVSCRDDKPLMFGVMVNPKVTIPRIRIHTDAAMDDRHLSERGKGRAQKSAQVFVF